MYQISCSLFGVAYFVVPHYIWAEYYHMNWVMVSEFVSLLLLGLLGSLRDCQVCLVSSALAQISMFTGPYERLVVEESWHFETMVPFLSAAFFLLLQAGALQLSKAPENNQELREQQQKQQQQVIERNMA